MTRLRFGIRSFGPGLLAAALAVAALGEPRVAFLAPWAALLCLALLLWSGSKDLEWRLLPPLVGLTAALIAITGFRLGADTLSYVANVVSLLQDGDFEQSNQFAAWGLPVWEQGPGGMTVNAHPVGNAFVWLLPTVLAHLYVTLTGLHAATFISPPYLAAMVTTNLTIALSGALALARLLARTTGPAAAALGIVGTLLASPILFYLAEQPLMSHALAFGLTCWAIVAVARAAETGDRTFWLWAGAALGLAAACRFQAAVLVCLVPVFLLPRVRDLMRATLLIAAPFALALVPQAIVSVRTFGSLVPVPQGRGFMNWASPHWIDTLFSADRGLFNWHPWLLLGLAGLALPRPGLRRPALAGLAVAALTTWTNGAVFDFNGSDAFGARRYDIVVPFFAIGLARLLGALEPALRRRPLALPGLILAVPVLANVLLMADYATYFKASAPADAVMAARGRRLQQAADRAFGWMGPQTRFRIYDAFVGLYTYRNFRPGGDFDLATLESRFLRPGWSEVQGWDDGTLFRYALFPGACIVIPLEEPFDLRGYVLARAPARIQDQQISFTLNGRPIGDGALPVAWTEVPFVAPAALWVRGQNEFCVRLTKRRPGDEGNDLSYAAAVAKIQLP